MALTDEQIMVRDMARAFAAEQLAPNAAALDRDATFPVDAIHGMADLGLLGMVVPEDWGGAGADTLTHALAIEEIAAQLESGHLDLAQALAAHQRGAALLAHAQALLDAAAKTIEVIDGQGSRSLPRDDLEAL